MKGATTRIGAYKCYGCRKPFTVKVGTIFEKSHIPMRIWLQAMLLLASSKKGISSGGNDTGRGEDRARTEDLDCAKGLGDAVCRPLHPPEERTGNRIVRGDGNVAVKTTWFAGAAFVLSYGPNFKPKDLLRVELALRL